MLKKKLSESMKSARAEQLKARAKRIDKSDLLNHESFHTEYYYGDDIDLAQLMLWPDKSPVMHAAEECFDNSSGTETPVLVFSRPGGIIFGAVPQIPDFSFYVPRNRGHLEVTLREDHDTSFWLIASLKDLFNDEGGVDNYFTYVLTFGNTQPR